MRDAPREARERKWSRNVSFAGPFLDYGDQIPPKETSAVDWWRRVTQDSFSLFYFVVLCSTTFSVIRKRRRSRIPSRSEEGSGGRWGV